MSTTHTRRTALKAAAGALGLLAFPGWAGATDSPRRWRWSGIALGARASITIEHPDRDHARRAVRAGLAEIRRIERVFSLYRHDSALSTLNRDGVLDTPPPELLEVLSLARSIHVRTAGAFDVSVQPLWDLYHRHFLDDPVSPGPPDRSVQRALSLVDADAIGIHASSVRLGRSGMAITLNGIAQGYCADRVSRVLQRAGCKRVLLDVGEIRALGDGWRVGLPGSGDGMGIDAARAVATSTPAGFAFDDSGAHHHLFDPASGRCASRHAAVTVIATSATLADGLSTACASLAPAEVARLSAAYEGVQVRLLGHDHRVEWFA